MNSSVNSSHLIITARKRCSRRLCFYTCLSTGGVVCVAGGVHGRGGHVWQGVGHAWQGVCILGGAYVAGGSMQILRDTVNERAVRILLESVHPFFTIALKSSLLINFRCK